VCLLCLLVERGLKSGRKFIPCCDHSRGSLLTRFRGLLGHRSRALCVGAFLIGGALGGMPIRPEEIEEHMRRISKAKVVQILEQEHRPSGDPPDNEGEIRAEVVAEQHLAPIDE